MQCLFSMLVALALGQVEEQSHWVSIDQKEGTCILRDFGDRPDGFEEGVKTWYGPELLLVCSFYVSSEHRCPRYTNYIDASGMFYGEHRPMYYNYNVAFFDAKDNLIACDGGELPNVPPVTSGATNATRMMPVPKGVHQCVNSYKVAHYVSDVAIGKAAWDEHKMLRVEATNGNTGKTTVKSWPRWKGD